MRKQRIKVPLWLRELGQFKQEIAFTPWPKQGRESWQQGITLMALGLNALPDKQCARMLAAFSKRDVWWVNQWKKERVKLFSRPTPS